MAGKRRSKSRKRVVKLKSNIKLNVPLTKGVSNKRLSPKKGNPFLGEF